MSFFCSHDQTPAHGVGMVKSDWLVAVINLKEGRRCASEGSGARSVRTSSGAMSMLKLSADRSAMRIPEKLSRSQLENMD